MKLASQIQNHFQIPQEVIPVVQELFTSQKLAKNEFFQKKNQFHKKLGFIQEGYIRIFDEVNDKEITQWISAPGTVLTDLNSFIFDQRTRWNMQALSDCVIHTIEGAEFTQLKEIVPHWDNIEKKFIADCFITLENRVFSHLSLSAEERYQRLHDYNKELFNTVPLQYLASMMGMTPETLSRIRKKELNSIS